MKIVSSAILGYCPGVRRAVDLCVEAARKHGRVWTYGELIHNTPALNELAKLGVELLKGPGGDAAAGVAAAGVAAAGDAGGTYFGKTIVICAHGTAPACIEHLKESGASIIDATCPVVRKNQLKAKELGEEGTALFLAGEKDHSEIIGIKGYNRDAIVVSNKADAAKAAKALWEKTAGGAVSQAAAVKAAPVNAAHTKSALLAQTTISEEEYQGIAREIKKYFPGLVVYDTICGATSKRQEALRKLCAQVDAVIIAGSASSSNTRRLKVIAESLNKPAILVERAKDIPPEFFAYKTVGLSAGASTPDSIIKEIADLGQRAL